MRNSGRYAFILKTSVEKEVCHAGKYALKEVIQEDHYENRRPHTCRGGKKNNIPAGEEPAVPCQ